jgi:hypothetical protein
VLADRVGAVGLAAEEEVGVELGGNDRGGHFESWKWGEDILVCESRFRFRLFNCQNK